MSEYFEIREGELVLKKPFPENMTEREALELSIEKHKMIRDHYAQENPGVITWLGVQTCGLCEAQKNGCYRCVVVRAGGRRECEGTPYDSILDARTRHQCAVGVLEKDAARAKVVEAEDQEIAFLESLRELVR